jgi:hypothetical protein
MAVGSKSVHEAILAVTGRVGRLQKGVEVAGIGGGRDYKVVGIEQIIEAIQPLLVEENLNIVPQLQSAKSWDTDIFNHEGTVIGHQHWAQVIMAYEMTGPDNSHTTAIVVGENENSNDKSMAAAMSMAEKYFYKQQFKLVTGDPDPDTVGTKVVGIAPETPRPAPAQNQQSSRSAPAPSAPAPTTGMNEKIANTAGSAPAPTGTLVSKAQSQMIWAVSIKNIGMDDQGMRDLIDNIIGRSISANDELTVDEFKRVKAKLEAHPNYTPLARK